MQNIPFCQILDYKESFHKHFRKQFDLLRSTPLAPQSYYSVLPSGNVIADQDVDLLLCAEMFDEEFDFTVIDQSSIAPTNMGSPMTIAQSSFMPFKKKIHKMNAFVRGTIDSSMAGNSLASPMMLKNSLAHDRDSSRTFKKEGSPATVNRPGSSEDIQCESLRESPFHMGRKIINLIPIDEEQERVHCTTDREHCSIMRDTLANEAGCMTSPNKRGNIFKGIGVFKNSAKDIQETEFDMFSKMVQTQQKASAPQTPRDDNNQENNQSLRESNKTLNESEKLVAFENSSQATHSVTNKPPVDKNKDITWRNMDSSQDSNSTKNALVKQRTIGSQRSSQQSPVHTIGSNSGHLKTPAFPVSPESDNQHREVVKPSLNLIIDPAVVSRNLSRKNTVTTPQNTINNKGAMSLSTEITPTVQKLSNCENLNVGVDSSSVLFDYTPKNNLGKDDPSYSHTDLITPSHKDESKAGHVNLTISGLRNQLAASLAQQAPNSYRSMLEESKHEDSDHKKKNTKVAHSIEPTGASKRKQSVGGSSKDTNKKVTTANKSKVGTSLQGKGLFSENLKKILKKSPKKKSEFSKGKQMNMRTWGSRKSSIGAMSIEARLSECKKYTEPVQRQSQTSNMSDIMLSLNMAHVVTGGENNSASETIKHENHVNQMLEDVKSKISKVEMMISKLALPPNPNGKKTTKNSINNGQVRNSLPANEGWLSSVYGMKALTRMNLSPSKTSIASGKRSVGQKRSGVIQHMTPDEAQKTRNFASPQLGSSQVIKDHRIHQIASPSLSYEKSPISTHLGPPSRLARKNKGVLSKDKCLKNTSPEIMRSQKSTSPKGKKVFNSHRGDVSIYDCKAPIKNVIIGIGDSITRDSSHNKHRIITPRNQKTIMNSPSKKKATVAFTHSLVNPKLKSTDKLRRDLNGSVVTMKSAGADDDKSPNSILTGLSTVKRTQVRLGSSPNVAKTAALKFSSSGRLSPSSKVISRKINI